jgi:hypothetical protein
LLPLNRCNGIRKFRAADIREPTAALSGNSRASRVAFVSFQRHAPVMPPAISAGNMQKMQFPPQKLHFANFDFVVFCCNLMINDLH